MEKPLTPSPANPYVTNEEHNMNIEKLEKISASTTTKMDEEVEPELAWAEMAEAENQLAQSQTIQIESPDMETSPTQNSNPSARLELLTDPLATLYNNSPELAANVWITENDGFTLVSKKRKSKNRSKATNLHTNSYRPKENNGVRRNPY